jgi:hypothetical protein
LFLDSRLGLPHSAVCRHATRDVAIALDLPIDTCNIRITLAAGGKQADLDMAVVVDPWPNLPEAIKAGILAMVGGVI